MSLNVSELSQIVNELNPILRKSRLHKIFQPHKQSVVIEWIRFPSDRDDEFTLHDVYIDTRRSFARMHLIQKKPKALFQSNNFCLYVRKHLLNAALVSIDLVNEDRIVSFSLFHGEHQQSYQILVEMFDQHSNLFLVNALGRIEYSFTADPIRKIHDTYIFPEKRQQPLFQPLEVPNDKLYNQVVAERYESKTKETSFADIKRSLTQLIQKKIKKCKQLLTQLEKEHHDAQTSDRFQVLGDLIKANLYQIKKGMSQIELFDYSETPPKPVLIPLDAQKSPIENMEAYFKKARKGKAGIVYIGNHRNEVEEEHQTLTKFIEEVSAATTAKMLEILIDQNRHNIYTKKWIKQWDQPIQAAQTSTNKKQPETDTYRWFESAQGVKIYVGRNQRENHELTFKLAKGNDVWMHCRDYPGSHIVIPVPKSATLDPETETDAIHLALFFSKAKKNGHGEIMVTQRKYIKRLKNAAPGQVMVSKYKTIDVDLDETRIQRLKRERD